MVHRDQIRFQEIGRVELGALPIIVRRSLCPRNYFGRRQNVTTPEASPHSKKTDYAGGDQTFPSPESIIALSGGDIFLGISHTGESVYWINPRRALE